MFDEMLDYARLYNSPGSNACRTILIRIRMNNIYFSSQKRLLQWPIW